MITYMELSSHACIYEVLKLMSRNTGLKPKSAAAEVRLGTIYLIAPSSPAITTTRERVFCDRQSSELRRSVPAETTSDDGMSSLQERYTFTQSEKHHHQVILLIDY
jgi:hypothetical protein